MVCSPRHGHAAHPAGLTFAERPIPATSPGDLHRVSGRALFKAVFHSLVVIARSSCGPAQQLSGDSTLVPGRPARQPSGDSTLVPGRLARQLVVTAPSSQGGLLISPVVTARSS